MRFVQFMRRNDLVLRLGILSKDGTSLSELETCGENLKEFIQKNYSVEEIQSKLKCLNCEPICDGLTFHPPITDPEKIICIGLNYKDHCEEQNKLPPTEPMFFSKFNNALVGHKGSVIAHSISNKIDWEVELAVIIGKKASKVPRSEALNYVFGYSVAQDISARDWQKERNGGQFLIGKSMDTFMPIGPAIVHKSLIKDAQNLNMQTIINGIEKQNGNTGNMIFKIDDIISRLSESITLQPGDIILTGTPKGVGMHRNPPEYLKPGDIIETTIECLGTLKNEVISN